MQHARSPARSRRWDAVALLLALAIGVLTLSPAEPSQGPAATLADALRNVVLFAPLALALAAAGRRFGTSLVACGVFSAAVELSQIAIPGRLPTPIDVACNSLGAALALGLHRAYPAWLRPPSRIGGLLRGVALLGVWGAIWLGGWLSSLHAPAGQYYGGWTPEFGGMDRHPGRVIEARIGPIEIPRGGPAADSEALRRALLDGAPIRVRWQGEAPTASGRIAPLAIVIGPASEELLLVATRGDDLLLRQWRSAARLLLEQPELVWTGALRGVDPRAVVALGATPEGNGARLALGDGATFEVGIGPGRGWALFAPDGWVDPDLRPGLDALWLAILFLPVGLWIPRGWSAAPLLAAAFASFWLLPERVGLVEPSPIEWAGALAGVLAGYLAQRAATRTAT